jgi:tetratricopeptide (TPR) repeat protein
MRAAFVAPLLAISIIAPATVHAEDKPAARAAYAEGTKYYDLNQFEPALKAFEKAYWNYEEPAFLFNIAQCYRQLDKKPEALKFYRSYLRKVPEAPNRAEVERLIASLEEAIGRERATRPPPKVAPEPAVAKPEAAAASPAAVTLRKAPPPERTPVYKKWWLWTVVGVVAAGAAAGIAVGVTQSQQTQTTFSPVHVP